MSTMAPARLAHLSVSLWNEHMPEMTDDLCRRQPERDSVFARRELLQAGVTSAQIRWSLSRGRWRSLLPGVVQLGADRPSRRQELIAAQIFGGDTAVISGAAAARFHGVRGAASSGVVDLLTSRNRARRNVRWARVRPTRIPEQQVCRGAVLRLASPERAVLDAARWALTQDEATSLVVEAVQRRLVQVDDLAGCLEAFGQRDTRQARRALDDAATGAWSLPEAELLHLVARSRSLPEAWANPVLVAPGGLPLISPDGWFDHVGLALMVHSRAHHEGGQEWDVTVTRDGELTAYGVIVAGVTPTGIRERPQETVKRIERTYAAARARPRPPITATPRHRGLWVPRALAAGV